MKDISVTKKTDQSVDEIHTEILGQLGPHLARWNFRLVGDSGSVITFERHYRPTWTIVVAILLFPIGLLALTVKETAALTFIFAEANPGATVELNGRADNKLAKALMNPAGW